jgi:hypothetical protein
MKTPITICSLPEELLVAIAAAGQEGRASTRAVDLQPAKEVFKSEWALSHTSRRFRNVVVGAPALWTFIEILLDFPGSVKIFKLYLQRSRACKISVTFRCPFSADEGLLKNCLRQIVRNLGRLWRLAVMLGTEPVEALAPLRNVEAPHLQHLEVITNYANTECIEIFSSGAPRLSFLKIDGPKFALPKSSWTAALTRLELWQGQEERNNDVLVAITAQCPRLAHLHLDISWLSAEVTRSRFHIPTLRSLHLKVSDHGGGQFKLAATLDLFDAPSLTEFVVDGTHGDQIFVLFNQRRKLPHASFPALTTLSFVNKSSNCRCRGQSFPNTTCHPPDLLFPALSSLTLINQCFASRMVEDILGQPWPGLRTLTLCPTRVDLTPMGKAVNEALRPDRPRARGLPALRLSPALLARGEWQDGETDVKALDPAHVLGNFHRWYSPC